MVGRRRTAQVPEYLVSSEAPLRRNRAIGPKSSGVNVGPVGGDRPRRTVDTSMGKQELTFREDLRTVSSWRPGRANSAGHLRVAGRTVPSGLGAGGSTSGISACGFPASKVLKDVGLVVDRPVGTRRLYHVDPSGVAELRAYLERFWSLALTSFRAVVEDTGGIE